MLIPSQEDNAVSRPGVKGLNALDLEPHFEQGRGRNGFQMGKYGDYSLRPDVVEHGAQRKTEILASGERTLAP